MASRLQVTRARESVHLARDLERALDAAAVPHLSRRAVPRELLEPAHESQLLRMALEEWGMIVAAWVVMAAAPWWLYPLGALVVAGRLHALGVVLHDATHMPLRRKTAGVRAVEVLCGYPIASTLNAMRYHHLRHHRDSGMHTDPYFKAGPQNAAWRARNILRGLALPPFWSVRAIVGAMAAVAPALRNSYARVFLQDRTADDLCESPEVIECARAEWGQLVFQALVVALAVQFPSAVLWGYLVPVSIAGLLAARRVLIEHTYERVADRQIETIISTTNDNHLGLLGALGLAPRNIGYHIVHHIHPQVRLGALPRLRAWYARQHPEVYPPPRR
jgi:fatty acid desaturase